MNQWVKIAVAATLLLAINAFEYDTDIAESPIAKRQIYPQVYPPSQQSSHLNYASGSSESQIAASRRSNYNRLSAGSQSMGGGYPVYPPMYQTPNYFCPPVANGLTPVPLRPYW